MTTGVQLADRHFPRASRHLLAAFIVGAASAALAAPKAGEAAPDFVGYSDGKPVSVAAYGGRVVIVSFWASWCGPCKKELPLLEGIARSAGKERVQVLAVNIESSEVYRKLARRMSELHMLVASDAGQEAQRAYGVQGIPHMVIIGKDGHIVRVHRGYSEAGVDAVVDDLNRALAP